MSRALGIAGAVTMLIVVAQPQHDAAVLGDEEACRRYSGIPEGWPAEADAGMVFVAGGRFTPGSSRGYREEWPGSSVTVPPFMIDRTEVTYAQYAKFVAETGYVTVAERQGGAPVFGGGPTDSEIGTGWVYLPAASWVSPRGRGAPAAAEAVVQVAYEDAWAYARWLGHELPTEAQWEFAARAGRDEDEREQALRDADGRWGANVWQGSFPDLDVGEDGFVGVAPVGCFSANPWGLYDVVGNVWEWTRDAHVGGHVDAVEGEPDSDEAPRVIKGGSFLCSATSCARWRVTARHAQETPMMANHLGFRTVRPLRQRHPPGRVRLDFW